MSGLEGMRMRFKRPSDNILYGSCYVPPDITSTMLHAKRCLIFASTSSQTRESKPSATFCSSSWQERQRLHTGFGVHFVFQKDHEAYYGLFVFCTANFATVVSLDIRLFLHAAEKDNSSSLMFFCPKSCLHESVGYENHWLFPTVYF